MERNSSKNSGHQGLGELLAGEHISVPWEGEMPWFHGEKAQKLYIPNSPYMSVSELYSL